MPIRVCNGASLFQTARQVKKVTGEIRGSVIIIKQWFDYYGGNTKGVILWV
jgi:hypothetical protein